MTKTFVHLYKRVVTQVSALTLVRFSNKMKRLNSCSAQFQHVALPVFEKIRRTVRWWWVRITYQFPGLWRFVQFVIFEKSRQHHSGEVKLSTGAIANIFKPAVAPTCNYRIKTKHALDRFYSEIIFLSKIDSAWTCEWEWNNVERFALNVLKNVESFEKGSCVTASGFVGKTRSRGSKYITSVRLRLQR